jgi:hypothetical protein
MAGSKYAYRFELDTYLFAKLYSETNVCTISFKPFASYSVVMTSKLRTSFMTTTLNFVEMNSFVRICWFATESNFDCYTYVGHGSMTQHFILIKM